MGRMYAVEFGFVNVTGTSTVDFFEIAPADDKPVIVHGIFIGQSSDAGDSEEELLRIVIRRGFTASGSGGSSKTPAPLDANDQAAGMAAEVANTTLASGGSIVTLYGDTFNIRTGWVYMPTPEMRPRVDQGDGILVARLLTAPADDLVFDGIMIVEEQG